MSVKCYGCFKDYSESEVTFIGYFKDGEHKLEACPSCLEIYQKTCPQDMRNTAEDASNWIMNYRSFHDMVGRD